MSHLCLTLRERPARRVDMSPLTPDRLAGKAPPQVGAIELASGNRALRVDSLFEIAGSFTSELEIRNACDRLDRIGAGMTHGRIVVRGDAGAYAGAGMRDGTIEVHGGAGAYAAAGMAGGLLHIAGRAGDFLAAALPGERRGMRGGTVLVAGDAGDRAGDRMRRGMVLVQGNAGDYCASRMGAGTIVVLGRAGASPGLGMRRGTLLLQQPPRELVPTFNDCGVQAQIFLTLLVRSWRTLPGPFAVLPDSRVRVRRYVGDLGAGGRGEILIWV